jgi:alkanesulfonate monooxygenase SsuD/methylene tetrahydromethanopterin reductase-like flavin-dependent oxidoreductase (luciferase family)
MTMKFGVGLITCQRHPDDPRSDVELYRDAIAVAVEAERLGFDSVWVSEHHFLDDAYMPSLLPVCAAIAARTTRITIGTGLLLAPLYEPIRLAEDAATVDLLSNGRFVLGLGQGWRGEEFDVLRVPMSDRAQLLEDTVSTLRQAWAGGPVTGGKRVTYPGPIVSPAPARAGGPPIWFGAWVESAIRRAGRLADGYMLARLERVDAATLVHEFGLARDELQKAGRGDAGFAFAMLAAAFAWPDAETGWQLVLPHLHYLNWKYEEIGLERDRSTLALPPPLTPEREDELRGRIITGDPEAVAAHIREYRDAVDGELHFIARLYWPGMPPDVRGEAMRLFAEEVIPRLR